MFDKNQVLISSALVYKESKVGNKRWFLIQNEEGEWEFPKTPVRKVESSVRASIRMIGEQGGMSIRVLEEAGRAGGVTTVGNKTVPIRYIYYIAMHLSDSGESVGFKNSKWVADAKILRSLSTKRDQLAFKQSRKVLRIWDRDKKEDIMAAEKSSV
ncbi:hypothetical protein ACFL2C_04255 [Patescibacteria group bacterium]